MQDEDLERYLKIVNSVLAAAFVLMLGNYLGFSPGITGNFFGGDKDPSCQFNMDGESRDIPIERCCYHASQQLKISEEQDKVFYGSKSINYSLNQAAVNYCKKEGFDIE